jgi:hypothetical protein
MKPFFQTQRAGSLAGPVLPFFLILLVLASPVLAQQSQQTLVIDSILGVGIGTSLDQAHEKLDRLSKREGRHEAVTEQEEPKGSRKEAWALRGTNYVTVALKVDREGRVVWITGFVRPGKEIPFAKLGNLSSATAVTKARAIWNVATPNGGYRVIAKGQNGKARVISLLSLATAPVQ